MDRLLYKDMIPPPKIYHKYQNIMAHIKSVERYMEAVQMVNNRSKIACLINTLDENVQTQLFSQKDFEAHENNYEWIKATLFSLFEKKYSEILLLIYLLGIRQKMSSLLKIMAVNYVLKPIGNGLVNAVKTKKIIW